MSTRDTRIEKLRRSIEVMYGLETRVAEFHPEVGLAVVVTNNSETYANFEFQGEKEDVLIFSLDNRPGQHRAWFNPRQEVHVVNLDHPINRKEDAVLMAWKGFGLLDRRQVPLHPAYARRKADA